MGWDVVRAGLSDGGREPSFARRVLCSHGRMLTRCGGRITLAAPCRAERELMFRETVLGSFLLLRRESEGSAVLRGGALALVCEISLWKA